MKGPEILEYFENNWPTNKGAWFPGERVLYRQKALFDDFRDKSWIALLMYGVKGEMPTKKQAKLLEQMWMLCASFPDPRIWNNRIAALAGTTRTTGLLAAVAANAVSEASIYGRKPDIRSSEFLVKVDGKVSEGENLESLVLDYLKKYRTIPGYGRPIISEDERIKPLLEVADNLGLGSGRYVKLVKDVESVLARNRYRLKANISVFCAALLADVGYSLRDYYWVVLLSFSAGIIPCYIDSVEKSEGAFFPLRTAGVNYVGLDKRRWVENE